MCLFERSASYRSKQIGWRDTPARFLHDLATNGVPMSLQSLKASCDIVGKSTSLQPGVAPERSEASPFRLVQPVGPVAGLV